jgi:hypothetical protein
MCTEQKADFTLPRITVLVFKWSHFRKSAETTVILNFFLCFPQFLYASAPTVLRLDTGRFLQNSHQCFIRQYPVSGSASRKYAVNKEQFSSTVGYHLVQHVLCNTLSRTRQQPKYPCGRVVYACGYIYGRCPSAAHMRQASRVRETHLCKFHPWGLADHVFLGPSHTFSCLATLICEKPCIFTSVNWKASSWNLTLCLATVQSR